MRMINPVRLRSGTAALPLTPLAMESAGLATLPLTPTLPLPPGQSEESITAFFGSIELDGAPKQELTGYWQQDWRRFVYTYGLLRDLSGSCLELGANPYFTTMLVKYFTPLEQTLANYFGPHFGALASQEVTATDPVTGVRQTHRADFHHFNIEDDAFPFPAASFDVVLFCEVLEHLQADPVRVLRELKRILKPSGHLILTTPNVARLENVCRMVAGENIYDPYSGYGPYGRHNREYNKHELAQLLTYCGFEVETLFSADVHENHASNFFPVERVRALVEFRADDLGQYLFSRSRSTRASGAKRPSWLYRSYPSSELDL